MTINTITRKSLLSYIFLLLLLAINLPLAAVDQQLNEEIHQYYPKKNLALDLRIQQQISIAYPNGKTQVLIPDRSIIPEHIHDIWIADFNFDQFNDIAIEIDDTADGLHEIYVIFIWDESYQRLLPLTQLGSISNPELNIQSQILSTSALHGKYWIENHYKFTQGKAYLAAQSTMVSFNLWHRRNFDAQGIQTNKTRISMYLKRLKTNQSA